MKKIKYLLLGIVSLLGIGCSFGAVPFYFDYFTNNGGLTSYNLHNSQTFAPCIYKYYSKTYVADLQRYQQSCNSIFNSNFLGFSVYYDSNGNKLVYRLNAGSNDRPGYLFVLSSNLAGENITDVGNGAYSRILAGSDCLGSDIFQNGSFCTPNFIQLFTNKYYTISSLGNIYDSDYNGVHYYKGPVSPAVGLGYSFGFVTGSGRQNSGNHYYLNTGNGDFFTFRSVSFSGSNMSAFEGVLLMRLNNTSSVSDSSDYKLFALGVTGNVNDYSFIYSIYNCPSTAGKYDDCVFSEGGNISENFSHDFESSNPYSNLIYLLTKPGAVKLNNSYSSSNNQISLTSQLNSNNYYISNTTYTITLNLVPSVNGFDIIGNIEDNSGGGGNNGNDVEPIFDYNSYVINDLIVCYITSGEVCPYSSFNRSAFESSFDVSDSVWDGFSGFLVGNNAYLFLKEFCLNSSFIDYAYCSQLDLYSGALITIDYADGLLSYDIYGDGIVVSIAGLGSGQLGNVSCWGGNCSSVNTGLPNFVRPSDSDYYSGNFIDTGYFENFFNLQLTGYFMKCPRSYINNRVVIGQSVMNYLGGRDPFVFINCSIAAFNNGKSFDFLDRIDFPGPLMDLSGDNNILGFNTDSNKRLLFGFFDCLLAFGMLLIIRFFYHLFK